MDELTRQRRSSSTRSKYTVIETSRTTKSERRRVSLDSASIALPSHHDANGKDSNSSDRRNVGRTPEESCNQTTSSRHTTGPATECSTRRRSSSTHSNNDRSESSGSRKSDRRRFSLGAISYWAPQIHDPSVKNSEIGDAGKVVQSQGDGCIVKSSVSKTTEADGSRATRPKRRFSLGSISTATSTLQHHDKIRNLFHCVDLSRTALNQDMPQGNTSGAYDGNVTISRTRKPQRPRSSTDTVSTWQANNTDIRLDSVSNHRSTHTQVNRSDEETDMQTSAPRKESKTNKKQEKPEGKSKKWESKARSSVPARRALELMPDSSAGSKLGSWTSRTSLTSATSKGTL